MSEDIEKKEEVEGQAPEGTETEEGENTSGPVAPEEESEEDTEEEE
jgi:hypothetical protein